MCVRSIQETRSERSRPHGRIAPIGKDSVIWHGDNGMCYRGAQADALGATSTAKGAAPEQSNDKHVTSPGASSGTITAWKYLRRYQGSVPYFLGTWILR